MMDIRFVIPITVNTFVFKVSNLSKYVMLERLDLGD